MARRHRALIARKARLCGLDCPVYLCDTFTGVAKAGVHDAHYKGGEHRDTSPRVVEDLLSRKLGLSNVHILQGIFPDTSARLIEGEHETFRFCHVDVNVYQSTKDIVRWVWHRMSPGGIIAIDDYGTCGCEGITKYVDEQAGEADRVIVHNLNGHALLVKIAASGRPAREVRKAA